MSQSDIYELLKSRRVSGDWNYYSVEQIRKLLKDKGINISRTSLNNSVMALRCFGYLDTKILAYKNAKRVKYIYNAYRLKRDVID